MRQYFKSDILRLAKPIQDYKEFVIYFLIKNENIVYVGYDISLKKGMVQHIDFDRYFTIPATNEAEAIQISEHYIKTLKPLFCQHKSLLIGGTSDVINNQTTDYKEMFFDAAESQQGIPLVPFNADVKTQLNTYEKKYMSGKFVWLFNIDGKLYVGEYSDAETYSLNGKLYKPRQTKGSIGAQ